MSCTRADGTVTSGRTRQRSSSSATTSLIMRWRRCSGTARVPRAGGGRVGLHRLRLAVAAGPIRRTRTVRSLWVGFLDAEYAGRGQWRQRPGGTDRRRLERPMAPSAQRRLNPPSITDEQLGRIRAELLDSPPAGMHQVMLSRGSTRGPQACRPTPALRNGQGVEVRAVEAD